MKELMSGSLSRVHETISIGDYVLSGGEVAAMVVSDAVIRLVDGVISPESIDEESFENHLLEIPAVCGTTRLKEWQSLRCY